MSKSRLQFALRKGGIWPAIVAELEALGVDTYSLEYVGKHPVVRIVVSKRERRIAFSLTSGGHTRARLKTLALVRRFVKEARGHAA